MIMTVETKEKKVVDNLEIAGPGRRFDVDLVERVLLLESEKCRLFLLWLLEIAAVCLHA
uniref:Uncharacterized protein n=1 Tax=Peronospora matthiolae TaxID=2874970 RepID=A0AAV1TUV6_9STRA